MIYEEDLKRPYIVKIVEIDDVDVHVTFMETSTSTINLLQCSSDPEIKMKFGSTNHTFSM